MGNNAKSAIDIVLAESFKDLAKLRPIDKITIKEITDKAGVIRPTFYNHFQDKYELLEWIVEHDLFEPAKPLFNAGLVREGITLILTTMEKERGFYTRVVRYEGQNSFLEILKKTITNYCVEFWTDDGIRKESEMVWLTKEMVADYYANCLVYPVVKWAQNDMIVPVGELTDIFMVILGDSVVNIFGKIH